jgi:hypothetical protein
MRVTCGHLLVIYVISVHLMAAYDISVHLLEVCNISVHCLRLNLLQPCHNFYVAVSLIEIHSFISLSHDRPKAFSKPSSQHSAI